MNPLVVSKLVRKLSWKTLPSISKDHLDILTIIVITNLIVFNNVITTYQYSQTIQIYCILHEYADNDKQMQHSVT